MPFDPLTFWLKGSMFWATMLRQQHQAYITALCNMANSLPRESAADLAAEADSMRRGASKPTPLHRRGQAKKAAPRGKKVPA